jgi:hypothetical protein
MITTMRIHMSMAIITITTVIMTITIRIITTIDADAFDVVVTPSARTVPRPACASP